MTIAEDFWMRGHAAQSNLVNLTTYQAAVLGTATLQAWQAAMSMPVVFWTAMMRAGQDSAEAMVEAAETITQGTAKIVALPTAAMAEVASPALEDAATTASVTELNPVAEAVAKPKAAKKPAAKPAKAAPAPVAEPEPAPEPVASNPVLLDAPRGGKADDLKVLSGIGPKLETALNEFGIYHFDQIAGLTAEGVAWLNDNQKGFAMTAERYDLVGQAKAMVDK